MIRSVRFSATDGEGNNVALDGIIEYYDKRDAVGIFIVYEDVKLGIEIPFDKKTAWPLQPVKVLADQMNGLVFSALSTFASQDDEFGSRLIRLVAESIIEQCAHMEMHGYVDAAEEAIRSTDDIVGLLHPGRKGSEE